MTMLTHLMRLFSKMWDDGMGFHQSLRYQNLHPLPASGLGA
jgi:hypothetical protein